MIIWSAMALACAATDDVSAWCLLVVVGVARSQIEMALLVAVATVAPIVLTFAVARPLLARAIERGRRPDGRMVLVLSGMSLSARTTEAIGIHGVFGAFLFGPDSARQPHRAGNDPQARRSR